MLRRASTSALLPYAVRAIATPKIRHFSATAAASAHSKLIGALNSEIKSHELALMKSRGAPANLPFTIEDDPNYCHVMLRRDSGEEKMEVTVNPLYEAEAAADSEKCVYINVSLSKQQKGTLDIGANVWAHKIVMHQIAFSNPNTYHSIAGYLVEDGGNMQNVLREFVKSRGIDESNVGFLYNYMVEKRKSWSSIWNPSNKSSSVTDDVKNMNKFIEDSSNKSSVTDGFKILKKFMEESYNKSVTDDLKNLKKFMEEW